MVGDIIMDLLQEYKELYYQELAFKESLDNKITTGITFLTILGSGQILLWSQLKNFQPVWYMGVYMTLCFIATTLSVIAGVWFYKTHAGYTIRRFPIEDIFNEHNRILGSISTDKIGEAKWHLMSPMIERFANDAIYNRKQNVIKANRHRIFINFMCTAFIATFIAFACGVVIDYYETIHEEVTIMKDEDIKLNINLPEVMGQNGEPIKAITPQPEVVNETFSLHETNTNKPQNSQDE